MKELREERQKRKRREKGANEQYSAGGISIKLSWLAW